MQFYAGIQQANSTPKVGSSSGYSSASRPIELTPKVGQGYKNWTTATTTPLGLNAPEDSDGAQAGSFRITTPVYDPPSVYNVGSAVDVDGSIILSNFVQANPNSHTDCQPILKYYVQTGTYTRGTVMNFTQSSTNAANCDFTGGNSIINVELQSNGTWTANPVS